MFGYTNIYVYAFLIFCLGRLRGQLRPQAYMFRCLNIYAYAICATICGHKHICLGSPNIYVYDLWWSDHRPQHICLEASKHICLRRNDIYAYENCPSIYAWYMLASINNNYAWEIAKHIFFLLEKINKIIKLCHHKILLLLPKHISPSIFMFVLKHKQKLCLR
jgi:hypothetical protein